MAADRMTKINDLLRGELATEFIRGIEFPAGTVVSVIRVRTSKDLHYATVALSVVPDDQASKVIRLIKKQLPQLLDNIQQRVILRSFPQLRFIVDHTEQNAMRVEALLDSLHTSE